MSLKIPKARFLGLLISIDGFPPSFKQYNMELPSALFQPELERFLIFWEIELSGYNIKKFLIFSLKKAFFIFQEMKTPKKFLIFQETGLCYISGKGKPKKRPIFQEVTF